MYVYICLRGIRHIKRLEIRAGGREECERGVRDAAVCVPSAHAWHTPAYASIRQHTSAYFSIRSGNEASEMRQRAPRVSVSVLLYQ
jgi:hypothetical protein